PGPQSGAGGGLPHGGRVGGRRSSAPARPSSAAQRSGTSCRRKWQNMDGRWIHASLEQVEANSRALEECPGTPVVAHDAASMYEEIPPTLVGDDVAVAVLLVEPLHGPAGQDRSTSSGSGLRRSMGRACAGPSHHCLGGL